MPQPDLFLITGIPGTGKTTYGERFAKDFGFVHYDFEEPNTVNRCASNPQKFIDDIVRTASSIVVTWGFMPDHEYSLDILSRLRSAGFKLIWFDGDRPSALRQFQRRGTVSEELFYLQMLRIENSKIMTQLLPTIINPFDMDANFKPAAQLLQEIRRA